jgi:hypothetical protein
MILASFVFMRRIFFVFYATNPSHIGAINKLSGAVAKPASINLRKWFLSPTGLIKPWLHTEGNLLLCSSYFLLGFPTGWLAPPIKHFSGVVAREKEDFCKGSLSLLIFYFVIVFLTFFTLFLLASFYQKYKKISSFIVVIFACLLLVLLE